MFLPICRSGFPSVARPNCVKAGSFSRFEPQGSGPASGASRTSMLASDMARAKAACLLASTRLDLSTECASARAQRCTTPDRPYGTLRSPSHLPHAARNNHYGSGIYIEAHADFLELPRTNRPQPAERDRHRRPVRLRITRLDPIQRRQHHLFRSGLHKRQHSRRGATDEERPGAPDREVPDRLGEDRDLRLSSPKCARKDPGLDASGPGAT